jgi:hypothetical protein
LDRPVRWSSKHALADTIASFGPRARIAMVEMLADIDDGADLARWRAGMRRYFS